MLRLLLTTVLLLTLALPAMAQDANSPLVMPDTFVSFGNLEVLPVPAELHDNSLVVAAGENEATVREERWKDLLSGNRMVMLIFQASNNPLTGGDPLLLFGHPDVIVEEEYAFCEDGRAIYLRHTFNAHEIGETFAWDIRAFGVGSKNVTFTNNVSPDSPIVHPPPDPQQLSLTFEPLNGAISVFAGQLVIVLIVADGGAEIAAMCGDRSRSGL